MIEPSSPLRFASPLLSYGIAVLSVAIALTIKLLLSPFVDAESPFLLFFAAVIFSSLHGGMRAGITATLLAAVTSDYLFLAPYRGFSTELGQNLRVLLFVLESYFISSVVSRLQSLQHRLKAEQMALQQSEAALKRSYINLENRVQARTLELAQANQALQQEILERERIGKALRESERRFRAIFNQTFQFIGLMRPDGILLEANQTALRFGGIQRSDVVGRPFWEAHWWSLSPQAQQRLQSAIAQAAAGEFVRYEVDVLGGNGQIATIDFSIQPIQNDEGQVVLLIPEGRDITALKRAEQALRSFFDSASMMMGIVELVGNEDIRHLTENAAVTRFFGGDLSRQSPLASERGAPSAYIQEWIKYYRQSEQAQQPVRFEYWHEAPTGQRYCLSATVCPILGSSETARFAYIVEDISDRKQAELQIRQLNEALEQRVAERTAQLEAANQGLAREIVERERTLQSLQQAEESLRHSEERFRQLAETVEDIFLLVDLRTDQVLYVNPAYEKIWARSRQALYDNTEDWLTAVHPEDQSRIQATFKNEMIHGSYDTTYRVVRSDGSIRWVRDRGFPIRNAAGKTYRLAGLVEDITDRKQAEEALRLSEERFRIALQNSPIVVFNQDIDLRYTWLYNSKLDHEAETVLGKTDFDLMLADDAQVLSQIKRQVITLGQRQRHEVQTGDKTQPVYFDLTVEPLHNTVGNIVGITAVAIDITERKRIEAELQNRAQRQAAIARLGQQALSSLSLDDLMNSAVELITQTLGLEYCQILEEVPSENTFHLRWGTNLPTTRRSQIPISPQASELSEGLVASQESRSTEADASENDSVLSSLEVAITGPQRTFGVLGVHSTQSRTFSRDDVYFLQATANILAETIQRQRHQETLKQQAQELEQANRLKDEFLATLSHELRTPLNSMLNWSRILPNNKLDPEVFKRAVSAIARNTQSLAQIVEDVLDMSDIITGRLTLDVESVDLAVVIDQAVAAILLAAQAKQINIQSTLDSLPGQVLGDAARLQQVVWNLLSNAVKFTPSEGQVEIRLTSTEEAQMGFRYAQITVSDNGKGIDPDFIPFIFDRFRQEDSSSTRSYGGLGLGLAIARYLVELHGGSIRVDSLGPECGTTFTVKLPLAID